MPKYYNLKTPARHILIIRTYKRKLILRNFLITNLKNEKYKEKKRTTIYFKIKKQK